jgi:hypothetical protein
MTASETTAELFELALKGEGSTMDFYIGLADKFSHEENISRFWQNMADDEKEQIRILEDLRDSLTQAQLAAPAEPDILMMAVENARVQISDVLNMVRNLNDAYILAQLWENSEVCRVLEYLVEKYVPSGADDRFVRLHIATHKKKLVALSYAFGEEDERKNILASDLK